MGENVGQTQIHKSQIPNKDTCQGLNGSEEEWHHMSIIPYFLVMRYANDITLDCKPSKCYGYRPSDVIVSRKTLPKISCFKSIFHPLINANVDDIIKRSVDSSIFQR